MLEKNIHKKFATWARTNYPDVIFFSTKAESGSKGVRINNAKLSSNDSHPDIIFLEPTLCYDGLAIELKKDGMEKKVAEVCHLSYEEKTAILNTLPKSKDGKEKHIIKQWQCMRRLTEKGCFASFACCYQEAEDIFKAYMSACATETSADDTKRLLSYLESTTEKYNLNVDAP